jgi:glycerate dehydrogenase
MNITILDGYTLNTGDLSWENMNALGNVQVFDRTPKSKILERCSEADIVLTNKVPLDKNTLDNLPMLKYIGVLATGYNIVDVIAAAEKGIVVTNIPAYSTHSVAELTFGLILESAQHISSHTQSVREGLWTGHRDFSYTINTTHELSGKMLGVIGYGQIAKQVIRIAKAFQMKISVYTSSSDNDPEVEFVGKEQLFATADFLSINTSLRPDNEQIVNKQTLALMKNSAILINTSRGGLINEYDLAHFLNNDKIAGAALDVLSAEPPDNSNPLVDAKNCKITPHIAWSTYEARIRLMNLAISNIKAFQNGQPVNVVS